MKILALDTRTDIILLQAALADFKVPVHLESVNRFKDAFICLEQGYYEPDVILISSELIIREGFDKLLQLKTDERFRVIPIIVLTEFSGEEKHLLHENVYNTYFLSRPLDFNEMPELMDRIVSIAKEQGNVLA